MQAFGLHITGDLPLEGSAAPAGMRSVRFALTDAREIARRWPRSHTRQVLERRYPNGSLGMTVDHHEEAGYRVYAPRHGRHLIDPSGQSVLTALPKVAEWRWQRLLFSQVLPICAALQGLEVLHSSAVVVDGHAYALSGSPGVGKTSLALNLAGLGAELLTDDVIALEPQRSDVIAHAGPPIANVRFDQLANLAAGSSVSGRSDKAFVRHDRTAEPRPFRGLYLLTRSRRYETLCLRDVVPSDPRLLLGSTFVPHVTDRRRVVAQLELLALVSRVTRLSTVEIPMALPAAPTARAILADIRRSR